MPHAAGGRVDVTPTGSRSACNSISEICRRKFVESFACPFIRLHCRRVDQGSISIKGEKQTCLVARHIRLEPFERIFGYKERPLHRAVMSPKPDGTPCWIKNPALVWEADHQFRMTFSWHPISRFYQTFDISPIMRLRVARENHKATLQLNHVFEESDCFLRA